MAGHLAKAGHEVCVYNRTTKKANLWVGMAVIMPIRLLKLS